MQDDQMQNKRRALLALIAAAPAGLLSGAARAAAPIAYPTKPIRLIVPFVAGGGTDILARMLANAMGTRLGQSFVVDNVAGAGGTIGAVQAARAGRWLNLDGRHARHHPYLTGHTVEFSIQRGE